MTQLIPIKENENGEQIANGRDIHAFLGIGKDYSNWVKTQIKRLDLIEGKDYCKLALKGEQGWGGNNKKEYYFTINSGKHIGLVSLTEKGNELREYFIGVENGTVIPKPKQPKPTFTLPTTLGEALMLAAEKQIYIEANQPKIDFANKVLTSETTYTATQIAKQFGMTAIALNKFLCDIKVQFKQRDGYVLYANHQNKDYEKITTATYWDPKQETHCTTQQLEWSETGKMKIYEWLIEFNKINLI